VGIKWASFLSRLLPFKLPRLRANGLLKKPQKRQQDDYHDYGYLDPDPVLHMLTPPDSWAPGCATIAGAVSCLRVYTTTPYIFCIYYICFYLYNMCT
jgi:hypothetical protein